MHRFHNTTMQRGKFSHFKKVDHHKRHHVRRVSMASKMSGANSGPGIFNAHLTLGIPTVVESLMRNGIPRGILVDRYRSSLLAFLRFTTKKTLDAIRCSIVASTLLMTALGKSFVTSFASGRFFHVCKSTK